MTWEARKPCEGGEVVVPLHVEQLSVTKRRIVTGLARISTRTREQEHHIEVPLAREVVEIERRPVGQCVESMPSVRQEGNTVVIPVVEEELVVERRLILKEEIRVTRVQETKIHRQHVVTRKQDVEISRVPARQPQEPQQPQEQ